MSPLPRISLQALDNRSPTPLTPGSRPASSSGLALMIHTPRPPIPPARSLETPVIVDEDCDPSEPSSLQFGPDGERGALAGTALGAALLSMSGYEKTQEPYAYDYAATRPNQEQSYPGYAQPSFASQYPSAQARQSHGPSSSEQMPFISTSQLEARDVTYQASYPSYIDPRSRQLPEVLDHSPRKALHGTKLFIRIRTTYDLAAVQPHVGFSVMFGNKRSEASWQKVDRSGPPFFQYAVAAEIPPFDTTGYIDGQMPLLLNVDDEYGQSLGVVEVGDFTYEDASSYHSYSSSSPQDVSRKRKISAESTDYMRSPTKRTTGQQYLSQRTSRAPSVYSNTPSSDSPFLQTSSSTSYAYQSSYDRSQSQSRSYGSQYQQSQPQKLSYQYSPALSVIQGPVKSSGYTSYGSPGQTLRSPALYSTQMLGRSQAMSSPSSLANPPLIRTSTLQPSGAVPGAAQAFNPYAMYPNSKATLKIDGELDAMAEGWSRDEWEAKRRLVQFRRSQSGSTITTSFEAIAPEDRAPHSICISCIWWEEKQECFVTSVDTIYLLESLVAVRFTVEEKNRIRRNLEGFRPLTVSKAKPESEEFFKVIMGFPNPKPRNIEKDVKVFPWKILAHALKKIIGKYSASYSSTAGALPTPVVSGYGGGGHSDSGAELRHTASPRSASSSATSSAYPTGMTSTALSPSVKTSAGLGQSAGPPDLRVSVPQLGTGGSSLGPWATMQHAPAQYSTGLPAGAGRNSSWDFAAYIEPAGGSTTTLPGGQALQLQRTDMGAEGVQGPVAGPEAYQQYGQRTSRS
ncbi:transcriptional regulator medusa [Diplodia corticola]|uniref:Transcriptional regulator medusa n=1 Tax=Diplodia corticola TaxID=236234 RepID=A0A1J9S1C1_9PEZI|nr:transcriptional regulator medusa [Diplodia corticola]OJD34383.1 transcriptional regulator medusa [Diplodia corticola]